MKDFADGPVELLVRERLETMHRRSMLEIESEYESRWVNASSLLSKRELAIRESCKDSSFASSIAAWLDSPLRPHTRTCYESGPRELHSDTTCRKYPALHSDIASTSRQLNEFRSAARRSRAPAHPRESTRGFGEIETPPLLPLFQESDGYTSNPHAFATSMNNSNIGASVVLGDDHSPERDQLEEALFELDSIRDRLSHHVTDTTFVNHDSDRIVDLIEYLVSCVGSVEDHAHGTGTTFLAHEEKILDFLLDHTHIDSSCFEGILDLCLLQVPDGDRLRRKISSEYQRWRRRYIRPRGV